MSSNATDWLGQTVGEGRYLVVRCLRAGGMTHVYQGQDQTSGESVIIKVPNVEQLQLDDNFQARFVREIQALRRLVHQHIVGFVCSGEEQELPFVVLRYLEGGTLGDRMCTGAGGTTEPQSPEGLLTWLPMIAQALDFIHTQNYIHRNVKPHNILFDAAGMPALGDLGIARIFTNQASGGTLSPVGVRPGTPPYMAPEQLVRQPLGPWTDQFALAVVVYEWIAGKRPFAGETHEEVAISHRRPATPLHQVIPTLPEALSQAVNQALSISSANRFSACREFASKVITAIGPRGPLGPPALVANAAGNLDTWSLPISDFEAPPSAESIRPEKPVTPIPLNSVPVERIRREPAPIVQAQRRQEKRSGIAGTLIRAGLVVILMVLAALGGSFFLPGTAPQRLVGGPIAGWLESSGAPGWKSKDVGVATTSSVEKNSEAGKKADIPDREKENLSKRLVEAIAQLKKTEDALAEAERNKTKADKQLADANKKLADVAPNLKKAEDALLAAEKEKLEAETQLASAKINLTAANNAREKQKEKLNAIEDTAKQRKLCFMLNNATKSDIAVEIRWQLWTGKWSDWKKLNLMKDRNGMIQTPAGAGAAALQVRYNRMIGGDVVLSDPVDVDAQSFQISSNVDEKRVDCVYEFEYVKDGKEVLLKHKMRKKSR